MTEIIKSVFDVPREAKLTVGELAEALYEGSPHLEFLAHKLARQYRGRVILPPWYTQGDQEKDWWRGMAVTFMRHAIEGHYKAYLEDAEENFTEIIEAKGENNGQSA